MTALLDLAQRLEAACDMTGKPTGRHMVEPMRQMNDHMSNVAALDGDDELQARLDSEDTLIRCIADEAKLFDDLAAVVKDIAASLRAESNVFRHELREMSAERDLLQEILDGRPAINAGLPDSYIRWSQSIYSGEMFRAIAARGKLQ